MAYNPMPSPGRGLPALERARPELQQQRGPQMYGSARQAAVQEPLWQHDLVAWLDMELVRRRGADGGKGFTEIYEREVAYSWVLVFGTNTDEQGRPIYSNMQEAWTICTRLWDAGLTLNYEVSGTGDRLYLLVGAEQHVLENEAELDENGTGILMRLTETKGLAPFHSEFIDYYVHRLNGTVFDSGMRQRLVLRRMDRGILLPLVERMSLPPTRKLVDKLRDRLKDKRVIRAQFLMELFTSIGAYRTPEEVQRIFGPNTAKAAVLSKIDHFFAVYPPEHEDHPENREYKEGDSMHNVVLDAKGGVKSVGKVGMKVVRASQGKKRVHVGKKEMERRMMEKLREMGLKPMTYEECFEIQKEVQGWYDEYGLSEKFTGSLKTFFPTHDPDELRFFLSKWAKKDLIYRVYTTAKTNEGKYTTGAYYCDQNRKKQQLAFRYQPIDEIRDYFGDAVALYFCWVGTYTDSLIWPAFIGLLCSMANWSDGEIDPNESRYTIWYTLYFACWAVNFLGRWERKENELRFLWGNVEVSEVHKPRPSFEGVLRVNFITGRELMVPRNPPGQYGKRAFSWFLILVIIVFTTFCAIAAESLALLARKPENLCTPGPETLLNPDTGTIYDALNFTICDEKTATTSATACTNRYCVWEAGALPHDNFQDLVRNYGWVVVSLFANLFVMFLGEALFTVFAEFLNDFENHRLEQDYMDHLVVKNFVFQFISNYFIMFYIAYLRQIEYPIIGYGAQCDKSCMNALQFKMFFIFTGKTYGLKIKEYGEPIVKRWLNERKGEKKVAAHLATTNSDTQQDLRRSLGSSVNRARMSSDGEDDAGAGPTEVDLSLDKQMYLAEHSDGTFEDFLTMVVQFGFLALFAPACPLAPLIALLNNVIEIRMDALKVCTLYRRPVWTRCDTIGAWNSVMKVLTMIAVATNATMICFVGSRMVTPGSREEESISERVLSTELWIYVVLIEHGLVCLKAGLATVAPTQPRWVTDAKEVLEVRKGQMKTKEELNTMSLEVYRKDNRDVIALFDEYDADNSGYLESDEIRKLMKKMGLDLNDEDVARVMMEMDESGDGKVVIEEFDQWWRENGDKNKHQLRDSRRVWDEIDKDGDGSLDPYELRELLTKLGMTVFKQQDIEHLMSELDTDGDGSISYDEFDVWWRQNGGTKYKSACDREGEVEMGGKSKKGMRGKLKGELANRKQKMIDGITDDADLSMTMGTKSKRGDMIKMLQAGPQTPASPDPGSPDSSAMRSPSARPGTLMPPPSLKAPMQPSGNPEETMTNPLHNGPSPPRGGEEGDPRSFRIRFGEKRPLGLQLRFESFHDPTTGVERRLVRIVKVEPGLYGSQYSEKPGLVAGVIMESIGGRPTEGMATEEIYRLLNPKERPTEIGFSEFQEVRGCKSLTHGDTSDTKAAALAFNAAHKLGKRVGHRAATAPAVAVPAAANGLAWLGAPPPVEPRPAGYAARQGGSLPAVPHARRVPPSLGMQQQQRGRHWTQPLGGAVGGALGGGLEVEVPRMSGMAGQIRTMQLPQRGPAPGRDI